MADETATAAPPRQPLRGLLGRVGQILLAPRAALERIDRQGGGLHDAIWLVALATVTFRFPLLFEALLGLSAPSMDALLRVVSVAANEIVAAAWVVLPASVAITLLAGARRDSSRDLELGAACYAPWFAATSAFRVVEALTGARTWPVWGARAVAIAVTLPAFVCAIIVARRRTGTFPAPVIVSPGRRARLAGLAVAGVAAVALAGNLVWSARHLRALLPVRSGQAAPRFTLARADGQPGEISLAALRGQVVVLDFWATWCPPCLAMLPTLHELHAEWSGRGVTFLGINSDGGIEPEALRAFLREHDVPYPVGIDEGKINGLYKVRSLPTMIIIGKDGAVRGTFVGFTRKGTIANALEDAVAASP
jgi:thiol-disulfide isomerase/thioredoxin